MKQLPEKLSARPELEGNAIDQLNRQVNMLIDAVAELQEISKHSSYLEKGGDPLRGFPIKMEPEKRYSIAELRVIFSHFGTTRTSDSFLDWLSQQEKGSCD